MDWGKLLENLRAQTEFYARRANELAGQSGNYEGAAKEYRINANIASILASAVAAGIRPEDRPVAK